MLLEIIDDLAPFFYVLAFGIFTISSSFTILMYVPGSKKDYTNLENRAGLVLLQEIPSHLKYSLIFRPVRNLNEH